MASSNRLFVKITRENLPQMKDRYPYLYLEHGRLEVDDSSVKWIDASGNVVRLPIATLHSLALGPGTSVTHEAVKVVAAANCCLMWVGSESMLFYASGISPTADTRNLLRQVQLAGDPATSLEVARRMFAKRFPEADLSKRSLQEMMGMEGVRVRALYAQKAAQYGVQWQGRRFEPGKFDQSNLTNKILTACNAALYGIVCASVHSCGFSPHIGFIHSGSPLPFVYDLADLYKSHLCIDLAFSLTADLKGSYDKVKVSDAFRARVLESELLKNIVADIYGVLGMEK